MTIRFSEPGAPTFDYGAIRTRYGMMMPPGGKVVAYVHSGGVAAVNDAGLSPVVQTLAAGLALCRENKGDIVYVLPGHSENVTDATMMANLKAGTKIIGIGNGSNRPTFNWTATASQWAIAVANVVIAGLQLNVDGANGVVNAIDVNGADFVLTGCLVRVASGAALKATIALSLSAARGIVEGCKFYGTATHNVTDGILIDTAVDGIEIRNTTMILSATAANGCIRVTAAATNLVFDNLLLYNTHTSSTATIAIGDVAADGVAHRVRSAMKNDGTATSQGITFGTAALVQCLDCLVVDAAKASGIVSPAVET